MMRVVRATMEIFSVLSTQRKGYVSKGLNCIACCCWNLVYLFVIAVVRVMLENHILIRMCQVLRCCVSGKMRSYDCLGLKKEIIASSTT